MAFLLTGVGHPHGLPRRGPGTDRAMPLPGLEYPGDAQAFLQACFKLSLLPLVLYHPDLSPACLLPGI